MEEVILIIVAGIAAVTCIDYFGSISSRKWNYNYTLLTPLSVVVYVLIGYFASRYSGLNAALVAVCLVGIYDATVGINIAIKYNANYGRFREDTLKMKLSDRIIGMLALSAGAGYVGHLLA